LKILPGTYRLDKPQFVVVPVVWTSLILQVTGRMDLRSTIWI